MATDSREDDTQLAPRERIGQHYQGALGQRYLDYQRGSGERAPLNRWKFADHVQRSDVVVDFGCGIGALLGLLEARDKVGVEVNEAARVIAHKNGIRTVGSTDELGDGFADIVISNHALEHVLEPAAELRGVHRILRPGGRLVLWLPLEDWRQSHHRLRRPDPNHHLFGWTPLLLSNLLDESGFTVERCAVVTHAWPPPPYTDWLSRLPRPLWDLCCRAFSMLMRRRQLMAVAVAR